MSRHAENQIHIGTMKDSEADQMSLLFEQVVLNLPYYNHVAKASEIAKYTPSLLRASLELDPNSILVARDANEIVGFCFSRDDDGLVWLAWFGVHPEYRRRGVGSALLNELEQNVRAGRSHKIWCDCRTENESSKTVLSLHGFTQLCVVHNHWYGQDFILWEKLVC